MSGIDNKLKKTNEDFVYPRVVVIKAIYRSGGETLNDINLVLADKHIENSISNRESSGGKFISFTIEVRVQSADDLDTICHQISNLEGFMSLF